MLWATHFNLVIPLPFVSIRILSIAQMRDSCYFRHAVLAWLAWLVLTTSPAIAQTSTPTGAPTMATDGWYSSADGQDCASACKAVGLQCTNSKGSALPADPPK